MGMATALPYPSRATPGGGVGVGSTSINGTREFALLPFPHALPHHTHHAVTPPPRMNADGHAPTASSHITLVGPAGQAHLLQHRCSLVTQPSPPTQPDQAQKCENKAGGTQTQNMVFTSVANWTNTSPGRQVVEIQR